MNTIINYLGQASTWKGLVAIATGVFGLHFSAGLETQIIGAGMAIVGLINVLKNG